jgi:putative tryptophan/tyrosine transport system substrate-binding protein
VQTKLVASLAKPGGNVTGMINENLVGKRLEIFKEALPKISQVAVLWTPSAGVGDLKQLQSLAPSLRLKIGSLEIANHAGIDSAFASMPKNRPDALFAVGSPVINSARPKIIKRATENKLPIMGSDGRWANDGGLLAYSHDVEDHSRRAAVYVDKILKGAKPADLPVEQPTQFEFMVNLKTAKQIGLTIPPNVLARADRVIR